jgi:undecaprenyl-diphosphatase
VVDVAPIGPHGSSIGLSSVNGAVHTFLGESEMWYNVTEVLGLVAIALMGLFAIVGLIQLIKRKGLLAVDAEILSLGCLYVAMAAAYVLFEVVVINYRPTLIDGYLEASYPSSTTMLVMCVMPTAAMQLNARIKNIVLRRCAIIAIIAFTAFMVMGRLISGVHWITDIIGGLLFSAGIDLIYYSIITHFKNNIKK